MSYRPPAILNPVIYEKWLSENPKLVSGGPIELLPDNDSDDENAVILEARHISSKILPENYERKLIIKGLYSDYKGLKIVVRPQGFDYLLRADPTHEEGTFQTNTGEYGNWPHFHELDFYWPKDENTPGTRRIVTSNLYLGMPPSELLEEFLSNYFISDGRSNTIQMPIKGIRQQSLNEWGSGGSDE